MTTQDFQTIIDEFSYKEFIADVKEGENSGICPAGVLQKYDKVFRKNYAKAIALCFSDAEKGIESSQEFIGYCLLQGLSVKRNDTCAFYWYKRAAQQGSVLAQRVVSILYYIGRGEKQSYRRSAHWTLLAAEQGDPDSMQMMSRLYDIGQGVEKNKKLALNFLKRAAEAGSPSAQYHLARRPGSGISEEEVIKLLELAAEGGIESAKELLECQHLSPKEFPSNV